jgi:hypothetical protein
LEKARGGAWIAGMPGFLKEGRKSTKSSMKGRLKSNNLACPAKPDVARMLLFLVS